MYHDDDEHIPMAPVSDIPWEDKHNITVGNDVSQSTYMKLPVSEFGLHMLNRMGFDENKGLGKKGNGLV